MPPGSRDGTKLALFSRHLTSRPCFLIQIRGGAGARHRHTQGWRAGPGDTHSLAARAKPNSPGKTGAPCRSQDGRLRAPVGGAGFFFLYIYIELSPHLVTRVGDLKLGEASSAPGQAALNQNSAGPRCAPGVNPPRPEPRRGRHRVSASGGARRQLESQTQTHGETREHVTLCLSRLRNTHHGPELPPARRSAEKATPKPNRPPTYVSK